MTRELPRLQSGIPGLDTVLGGGFVEGSSYLIEGAPGAGKTILASQIAFAQAREGRRVLYATLMAESHERLFGALSTLKFYDPAKLGDGITFVSVFQSLRNDGLGAVVSLLRQEIARQEASLLVIDGLLSARDNAATLVDVRSFVAELQGHAAFAQCTVLFLSGAALDENSPEHTMVEGVIELRQEIFGARAARRLVVRKSRGSEAMGGLHQFHLDGSGITVYPRLEAKYRRPDPEPPPSSVRHRTGVSGLDEVVSGGLPDRSFTLVSGPAGSGKTTFGLCFLTGSSATEPGLYWGFHESPERILRKGETLGLGLSKLCEAGALDIVWRPGTENLLDQIGHDLIDTVQRRGIKRLFIDGMGTFERAAFWPDRVLDFLSVLAGLLRSRGVTVAAAWEVAAQALPPKLDAPAFLSALDNLILINQMASGSELRRSLAVIKMRDSGFDPAVRTLSIGHGGLIVGERLGNGGSTIAGTVPIVGPGG